MKLRLPLRTLTAGFFVAATSLFGAGTETITIHTDKPGAKINRAMWGVFFEDINFGADGGLYAELVKNRSFEFSNPLMGWTIHSSKVMYGINLGSDILILNRPENAATNPRYLRITLNNTKK